MTGLELKSILDEFDKPPTHSNKSVVFSLYHRITGKQNDRNCLNCAIECFIELKHIAKHYGENEIILSLYKKGNKMETINPELKKYRVKNPFRIFGSAKLYSNLNTTDREVEFLLNFNKSLMHHFEFLEQEENKNIVEEAIEEIIEMNETISEEVIEQKPKKARKKRAMKRKNG